MKHDISDKLNRRIKNYHAFPSKSSFSTHFDFPKRKGKMVCCNFPFKFAY